MLKSKKFWAWFTGLFLVSFLANLFLGFIPSFGGFILAGIACLGLAAFFFMTKNPVVKEVVETVETKAKEAVSTFQDPNTIEKEVKENLLEINIFIRTVDNFSEDIKNSVEEIINLIFEVAPGLIEKQPSQSVTFQIKNIANKDLLKTLEEFTQMTPENQEKHIESLKKRLEEIKQFVLRGKKIADGQEEQEFRVEDSFMETKFSDPLR